MKHVVVIGAGINGLCTAYYLQKKGYDVTLVDQGEERDLNCSYGNAGLIVPSHIVPMASPGVITQGLKWMLNSRSPFYIKPRWNRDLFRWIRLFRKNCTKEHVNRSSELLYSLNLQSLQLYKKIISEEKLTVDLEEKGLLMVYQQNDTEQAELEHAKSAEKYGVEIKQLTAGEVKQLAGLDITCSGGILYKCDAHFDPSQFMTVFRNLLKSKVTFKWNFEVFEIVVHENLIKGIRNESEEIQGDAFVIASGSWSSELLKKTGLELPLQAGKGYSFRVYSPEVPALPLICCESKIAVTPFSPEIQFAGTMEIGGLNRITSPKRVKAIKDAIPRYFPSVKMPEIDERFVWNGLRPCSADGIPYIGKGIQDNLWINTGHGMMGMSLGPVSGLRIADSIQQNKTDSFSFQLDPKRFH